MSARALSSWWGSCRRRRRGSPIGGRSARGREGAREPLPDDHRRGARRARGAGRQGDPTPRALHRGRDARRDPPLGSWDRRPQPALGHGTNRAADDPLRDGPDRLGLRHRAPGHSRDVRGHGFSLAATDPRGRPCRGPERPARPRGEGLDVRIPGDQANLSHDVRGRPEPPERVHWDPALAGAVGVPAPYDYGPERVAWLGHLVTNWMGDDGFLARLNVQVRRHNLIGDTTWCRGRVAAKAVVDERGEVTLDLVAVNHRDETIAQGQAVVVLPRRSA